MVIDEKLIARIIGVSVGTYPNDVAEMLTRNNVLKTSPNFTIDQLVNGVFDGLKENQKFIKEYSSWLEQTITTLEY